MSDGSYDFLALFIKKKQKNKILGYSVCYSMKITVKFLEAYSVIF